MLERVVGGGFYCVPRFESDAWLEPLRGEARFAALMKRARLRAVLERASVAIKFVERGGDWSYGVYLDGNANGVRAREIRRGVDRLIVDVPSFRLRHRNVRLEVLPGDDVPKVPPATGLAGRSVVTSWPRRPMTCWTRSMMYSRKTLKTSSGPTSKRADSDLAVS